MRLRTPVKINIISVTVNILSANVDLENIDDWINKGSRVSENKAVHKSVQIFSFDPILLLLISVVSFFVSTSTRLSVFVKEMFIEEVRSSIFRSIRIPDVQYLLLSSVL